MLNRNDPELLSAYLDDALSPEERAALEARLQTDADLRRDLARLHATVELIGTLPPLRAPRDFTLTPRMARRPSLLTSPAFSVMSAAAAVILLVIGAALFSIRPSEDVLPIDQLAFAPTTVPAVATAEGDTTSSALPQTANGADASTLKSETESGSDGLFFAAPTGTPAETMPPPLYAAQSTEEAVGALEMLADTAVQESQDDLQRDSMQQPAPSVAGNAAAAEAPLPQPTVLPSQTPSVTHLPTQTATPLPTSTPTPPPLPTLSPEPVSPAPSAQNVNTVGITLIVVALLLFGAAAATTFLRRRG